MRTDAQGLLKAGLDLASLAWNDSAEAFGWSNENIHTYAVHQVSKVHTDSVTDLLGFDPQKVPTIYEEFGNIGPASVPTVLSKEVEAGSVTHGDRVLLTGMGSGINSSIFEVTW